MFAPRFSLPVSVSHTWWENSESSVPSRMLFCDCSSPEAP